MKRTKNFLGVAGCLLAAGSLCADPYNENFEGDTSTWTGDGTITNTTYQYSGIAGLPLSGDHTKVLVIEGDSSYTAQSGSFAGSPLVDMMVQAALPDDELETPEGEPHIAVAVDTNGIFNVYCKNKSGTAAGWYPLSSTAYADGAWARVSLLFDYANGRCQVRLDGQPMMTANGYYDATTTDTTKNGAWYKLAYTGTTAPTAVSNLKVVGCTAIDDVVIAADASSYAVTSGATAPSGLACAWLDQYGLAWDAATAGTSYDSTGMTVAQKYNYCFSPFDDQAVADFAVKSISTTAEKVTLALPTTVANGGRKVVVDYGADKNFGAGTTTEEVTGETTVQINVPAPGSVTYYRLRATDKTNE